MQLTGQDPMINKLIITILIVFSLLLGTGTSTVSAASRVNGYTRKNGTYVQPYYKTSPNSVRYDNYSYKGNYNPYSGKTGTRSYYK